MVRRGKAAAQRLTRARALLLSDVGDPRGQGPGWIDADIAEALGITTRCIQMLRKRAVEEGPLSAIERKAQVRPSVPKKFDGEKEAKLIALACSEPPAGHRRWSLRLLADKLVEMEVFESVSHERVREVMKKNELKRGASGCGASRPCRARRSFVRWKTYFQRTVGRTIRSVRPRKCGAMDEQPKQLIAETRRPLPCEPGQVAKVDHEYRRHGVASVWMFTEPLV
ncbi:MAG: helix-turn-helix domain-containing protein, partial [Phycisphaeraceae bacterium]